MPKPETTDLPHGFETAKAEWNEEYAGRPYTVDDWYGLTFGDQQRYGARECKTKDAIYSTHVSRNVVSISITLPQTLLLNGLTEGECKWIEDMLHRKMEETIHWIITSRQMEART